LPAISVLLLSFKEEEFMSYKVVVINSCTKKVCFDFEKMDLSAQIEKQVKEKQKSSNIKGFRAGKAPIDVVKKIYGGQIETDALNAFIQKEFFDAITKENLKVVGYPSFENMKYIAGEKIAFDAVVELFPEFELKDMGSLSFTKEKVILNDDEIEKVKKSYLESKAEIVSIEDSGKTLEKGYIAIINFEGVKENNDRPDDMKGKEYSLEIGSNSFIPGFEEQMIGMKKGEKKNIGVTFPMDYHAEDLKDAKVTFEVELLEIKEKKLPEFSDELAKEFKYESMQDFYEKTKKSLMYQKERKAKEKLHQEVLEKLVEDNSFDVPKTMLAEQLKYLKEDMSKNLKYQGFNENMIHDYLNKWAVDLDKKAKFQVSSGLILDKLANKYGIEAGDADFEKKIEETADQSGMDKEQIRSYYSEKNIKKNLMFAIREEKTFEHLISELNVAEL